MVNVCEPERSRLAESEVKVDFDRRRVITGTTKEARELKNTKRASCRQTAREPGQ